ncbi:integral membrane protein [Drepanopeziza brunnea f. sp. 'multigermtubi' MB_m1]|uniref:Efficient mitochondria targeting-associated protein 19 n=1 Tax=Marssonina brunnea f. sp. multigermtubi (strain MB_m1) TaxID=1072389 RepID=K1WDD2_MARBU|nr:uncharacterized protein MBM_06636 [Drepanopeziza brunnea f. sp. 'multigermtubi' MB_m1]EKD15420.1 integral membrane protein [Drepanopeziza brunnea f. sp. 'multigermtubi' MB_m1]
MATTILSRKRDLAYMIHFSISLPLMFLMDLQAIYPPAIVPGFMKALEGWYIENYHDQFFVTKPAFFQAFIASEILYQAPAMVIALRLLYTDSPKVPLVLLPYSMLIFATTATCMFEYSFWDIPLQQKIDLTTLYGPYLAISAFMFGDMSIRLNNVINAATTKLSSQSLSRLSRKDQ